MPAEVTTSNPPTLAEPTGYTHAVQISGEARRLVISGQVGVSPDGSLAATPEGQVAQVFANLQAVLAANDMAVANIIKTTVFLTDRDLESTFRSARRVAFGDHTPASTVLFVSGLADPRFVVEIEAEAVA